MPYDLQNKHGKNTTRGRSIQTLNTPKTEILSPTKHKFPITHKNALLFVEIVAFWFKTVLRLNLTEERIWKSVQT